MWYAEGRAFCGKSLIAGCSIICEGLYSLGSTRAKHLTGMRFAGLLLTKIECCCMGCNGDERRSSLQPESCPLRTLTRIKRYTGRAKECGMLQHAFFREQWNSI